VSVSQVGLVQSQYAFLSAKTSDHVFIAQTFLLASFGKRQSTRVRPTACAIGVVDLLEMIQVYQRDTEVLSRGPSKLMRRCASREKIVYWDKAGQGRRCRPGSGKLAQSCP